MYLFPLGIIVFQKPSPGVAGIVSLWINVSLSSMDYTGIFLELYTMIDKCCYEDLVVLCQVQSLVFNL